jgi:FkbM family methyltransferase
MSSLLGRLQAFRQRVAVYQCCFGRVRGVPLALAARSSRWNGRYLTASSESGHPVVLRAGTTDFDVYKQVMIDQEYEHDLGAAPKVIIDAGAHIGLASIWFASRYPDALVVAIEPERSNFELLTINTAGYENVRVLQAALWVSDSSVDLHDPGWGTWGFRIGEGSNDGDARVVQAVTVEGVMRRFNLDHVDLLKLDVEGAEIEILSDCSTWIDRIDCIVAELHDRFRPGCSRAFFAAVADFPDEQWNGENVFVSRTGVVPTANPLGPVSSHDGR